MRYFLIISLYLSCLSAQSQILESYLQFANHTDLELTSEYRVLGSTDMVTTGQSVIRAWQNPNHHKDGDSEINIFLGLVFDIYISHERECFLAKCNRFSFLGDEDYNIEVDILHDSIVLFTIIYDFRDVEFNFHNPTKYNVRYPDNVLDNPSYYNATSENGNNPHLANREILINGISHTLIYGTFQEDIDPTKDVIFSLSETNPTTHHVDPDAADLLDPNLFNVLTYNMGILQPLGVSDKEEDERSEVAYKAMPKNMDAIIFTEFFYPQNSNKIINSLLPWYPYTTEILNSAGIVPGIEQGGGVVIMSKHPIEEEKDYSFQFDGDADVDELDLLADKGVKYAKINKHGQIIHVFGSHFHFKPTDPSNLSQFIYETLTPNKEDIVIIGGDLNVGIFSSNYQPMVDTFHAIEPTYKTFNHGYLQRGTVWSDNHYISSNDDGRPQNIDYIFSSKDFKVPTVSHNEAQAYRLNSIDRDFWGIYDLGDHQPLYGRFEFPSISSNIDTIQVCEGDSFKIDVLTSLNDYTVEWFKNDILLEGENHLTLSKNYVSMSDWGDYTCEIIYYYEADSSFNGSNPHPNYLPYVHQGKYEGRLIKNFKIEPISNVCQTVTDIEEYEKYQIATYPNPVDNYLFVSLLTNSSFQVKISDIQGKIMYKSLHDEAAKINMIEWNTGVYSIELTINKKRIYSDLIIKE